VRRDAALHLSKPLRHRFVLFLSGLADDSRTLCVERSKWLPAGLAKLVLGELAAVVRRQSDGHRLFVIFLDP